jgi:hypothetical protein
LTSESKNSQIHVGEVFHRGSGDSLGCRNLRTVTKGVHDSGVDPVRGISFFSEAGIGANKRRPAGVFYSNNLHGLSQTNPWPDLIEPDRGRAVYHGDNKSAGAPALTAPGNKLVWDLLPLYSDPASRHLAPPILIFEQVVHEGKRQGFRSFSGYGVPTGVRLQSQAAEGGSFSNLSFEIALFEVDAETDSFDWKWIDDRRTSGIPIDKINQKAPQAWKRWIKEGSTSVDSLRRVVYSRKILTKDEQLPVESQELELLKSVHNHYSGKDHRFEAIASLVASKTMGPRHSRGWVTKRSGDGGVDFVSRVEIGRGFTTTDVVVLGQAKNIKLSDTVPGRELARLVARIKRGWLGAFVTTATFTPSAQREVVVDEYPLVLVHGRDVASTINQELVSSGLTLDSLLSREDKWYAANQRDIPPEQILRGADIGSSVWPGNTGN